FLRRPSPSPRSDSSVGFDENLPGVEPEESPVRIESMPKKTAVFSCTECGSQSPKWLGRCPDCNAWNSFAQEEIASNERPLSLSASTSPLPIGAIDADIAPR